MLAKFAGAIVDDESMKAGLKTASLSTVRVRTRSLFLTRPQGANNKINLHSPSDAIMSQHAHHDTVRLPPPPYSPLPWDPCGVPGCDCADAGINAAGDASSTHNEHYLEI